MSTKKPYNELKRQNTLRKILKFFFVFFRKQHTASRQNQVCSKLYVSKANFQSRISTDFEHYTLPQHLLIQILLRWNKKPVNYHFI